MNQDPENNKLAIFEDSEIRRVLFDGDWYYSIEDIIIALTDSKDPKQYIQKLKQRNEALNEGWVQFVLTLPLSTAGGKQNVNCASTEGVLRIIQEVPSKKAEPFKRWLAKVGNERLDEIAQPAKAIERAKGYYLAKGYTQQWVQTRIAGIDTRITFTDTLKESGIEKGHEYAILTNEMYHSWSGFSASEHKNLKGLDKKESLRDNMTPLELATTIFSEATATEVIEKTRAKGFVETKNAIHIAGKITNEAIKKIEEQTGKKVVTHENMKDLNSPEIQKEIIQKSLPSKDDDDKLE